MSETLYAVVISTDAVSGNIIEEMLPSIELFPTSYFDSDDDVARMNLYHETPDEASQTLTIVQEAIGGWQEIFDLDLSKLEIFTQEIKKEDWTESWKSFFHVIEVSDRLVVKPSWEPYEQKEGQVILEIDPGMSFGTGNHGTTRACLEYLDQLADGQEKTFIDMGCGSGILSIAASKLGYKDITSFDYDSDAVKISAQNYELSKCEGIEVFEQDLSKFEASKTYDLVVANILAPVLIANADKIVAAINKDSSSRLVLSGILHKQFTGVVEAFEKHGLKCIDHKKISEWSSGLLSY
jgi:ribosomal protein L11 methyltransferase